jgi:hypothetical protein
VQAFRPALGGPAGSALHQNADLSSVTFRGQTFQFPPDKIAEIPRFVDMHAGIPFARYSAAPIVESSSHDP